MSKTLFGVNLFSDWLAERQDVVFAYVRGIDKETFQNSSDEKIFNHVYSKYSIGFVLKLHADKAQSSNTPAQIDVTYDSRYRMAGSSNGRMLVDGYRISFKIPFEGNSKFFYMRPSSFKTGGGSYNFSINGNIIEIKCERTAHDLQDQEASAKYIKSFFENAVSWINFHIDGLNELLLGNETVFKSSISDAINHRRKEIGNIDSVMKMIDIPIETKDGAPNVSNLPVYERIAIPLPSISGKPQESAYAITDTVYDAILTMVRHTGLSFEGTPETYVSIGEEGLRSIILSHLNCQFKGNAKGEVFSKTGKTDIHINEENRAAFIAECKIWGGQELLKEAITQLLGYLTWRDCKTALILFNKKNKDFSKIQNQMKGFVEEHPNFKRWTSGADQQHEWECIFKGREDEGLEIRTRILLFNLYVSEEK